MNDTKPRVLVLGGVGMIGRNFVKYLIDHDLCSYIRVADKSMPEIAYFSDLHKKAFADKRVQFVQADLTRDVHVDRAYNPEYGPYDYVYNLAGETKGGLSESVYASKCRDLSVKCGKNFSEKNTWSVFFDGSVNDESLAKKAATFDGVKRYIEVSTAFVYKSQAKQPASETADLQPWTLQAKYKLEAEEQIREIKGLDYVIVRPATVYGSADVVGLMPRIVCAASYFKMNETMKLLWDAEMRVNTVHVYDVVQALWHVASHGESGEIYNLADKNDTNQKKINEMLEEIFSIKTGFQGKLISNLARLRLNEIVDDANDKHMRPWADLCAEHGVTNTPLTPFIDKELLQNNHLYIDGSKIEESGFVYSFPKLEADEVHKILEEMVAQKIFPPIFKTD